jgi:hypothetical protein
MLHSQMALGSWCGAIPLTSRLTSCCRFTDVNCAKNAVNADQAIDSEASVQEQGC